MVVTALSAHMKKPVSAILALIVLGCILVACVSLVPGTKDVKIRFQLPAIELETVTPAR